MDGGEPVENKVEAFDVWHYFSRDLYEPFMRSRLDFSGRLQVDALEKSIALTFKAVPLLSCVFKVDNGVPKWQSRPFKGEDALDVVKVLGASVADRYLTGSIDISSQPQLKVFLLRGQYSDSLGVIMSHMICDGAGFKKYLYLLADIYSAIARGDAPTVPPPLPRGSEPLFSGLGLKDKWQIAKSRYSAYAPIRDIPKKPATQQPVRAHLVRVTIPPKDFSYLKSMAKAEGATVNDALMALFARAISDTHCLECVRFPATMDLRKFIPEGTSYGIGNYSSNCMCSFKIKSRSPFLGTLKDVSRQMAVHKKSPAVLKSVLLWEFAFKALPYPILKKVYDRVIIYPRFSFTNVGILDEKRLSFGGLPIRSACMTGTIKKTAYTQMSVSTFKGACTLCCNIIGTDEKRAATEKLLKQVAKGYM